MSKRALVAGPERSEAEGREEKRRRRKRKVEWNNEETAQSKWGPWGW